MVAWNRPWPITLRALTPPADLVRPVGHDPVADLEALLDEHPVAALVAALIYERLFPAKAEAAVFIYLVGILIEGIPMLVTAIRGFISRDVNHAMEILVAIAIIACFFDRQFALAILVPVVLNVVHFFEERSIMGGRDVIDGLRKMQSETAVLYDPATKKEREVDAKELRVG